jgi:hypothetical protein
MRLPLRLIPLLLPTVLSAQAPSPSCPGPARPSRTYSSLTGRLERIDTVLALQGTPRRLTLLPATDLHELAAMILSSCADVVLDSLGILHFTELAPGPLPSLLVVYGDDGSSGQTEADGAIVVQVTARHLTLVWHGVLRLYQGGDGWEYHEQARLSFPTPTSLRLDGSGANYTITASSDSTVARDNQLSQPLAIRLDTLADFPRPHGPMNPASLCHFTELWLWQGQPATFHLTTRTDDPPGCRSSN